MRAIRWSGTAVLLMVTVLAAGCGPGAEEQAAAARQAALTALEEAKQGLDSARDELAELRERLAAAASRAEEEAEAAAEELPSAEEIEAQIEEKSAEVLNLADEFGGQLVKFINDDPPVVGEPMTEVQQTAIRMKSDEDIILAQGYIDEGGDYARAIRIYEDALLVDPGNEKLEAALEAAQRDRYMTEERFAEVSDGMTRDQVRELLGQVNLRNIREYPDRNVVAWFYPKDETGNAAAVFFRKKGEEYISYETNFNAVKSPQGEGG